MKEMMSMFLCMWHRHNIQAFTGRLAIIPKYLLKLFSLLQQIFLILALWLVNKCCHPDVRTGDGHLSLLFSCQKCQIHSETYMSHVLWRLCALDAHVHMGDEQTGGIYDFVRPPLVLFKLLLFQKEISETWWGRPRKEVSFGHSEHPMQMY